MDWFEWDFDHPLYFEIYKNKEAEATEEGFALAEMLDLPPNALVLDLPCGWGRLRPSWESRGWGVVGGDLSRMNLARHTVEHPGDLVRLDLRALPFRDACADGVVCAYTSWGYFASDAENLLQLSECARALKPGGVLVLDLAGRGFLENAISHLDGAWYSVPEGYRERVRWSSDLRRIFTERIHRGVRFRHDIWIPTDTEVRTFAARAGLTFDHAWGGLAGEAWHPLAERWIYRFMRR